ncbi:MAG: AbrB/MazE/SpoVT family DNA-binding domain-containing protein [Desulfobacterales bacterium]|nr:AbrB/MazE/SpoVT family DNA-binding domain-containing protein [Desulfobacterales bacterium]
MRAYSITPKGQVTIPIEIRKKLKLRAGDKIVYEHTGNGIVLKPTDTNMLSDFGFLKDKEKSGVDLVKLRKVVREKIAERLQ